MKLKNEILNDLDAISMAFRESQLSEMNVKVTLDDHECASKIWNYLEKRMKHEKSLWPKNVTETCTNDEPT